MDRCGMGVGLLLICGALVACSATEQDTARATGATDPETGYTATETGQPGVAQRAPQQAQHLPQVRLERVSAGVPWPRGIAWVDDELVVIARGRHRNYGGPAPDVFDREATLFRIDPNIREEFVPGAPPSAAVLANATVLAEPDPNVIELYDRSKPVMQNYEMQRPFCTLVFDAPSRLLITCAYSGVDANEGGKPFFRKNATDAILAYDLRTQRWLELERHDETIVPIEELTNVVPNIYYPHHDPSENKAPHGWLNGPNGCIVLGHWLYAVGKDNHSLARYDLRPLRADPQAGPPPSERVLEADIDVRIGGKVRSIEVKGHSAVASDGSYLYLASRTSSLVIRFPITADGDLVRPIVGEIVAEFEPWSNESRRSAELREMIVDPSGHLLVVGARMGRIWRFKPDPNHPFDGNDYRGDQSTSNKPYIDMRKITGNDKVSISNMAYGPDGSLYLCSVMPEEGRKLLGNIFRITEIPGTQRAP